MIKLKLLIPEVVRQMVGETNASLNATLSWLDKDGTIYNTDDMQHGLYVADHPDLFGVSNDFVRKVLKKFGEDYDGAAAIMCEKAFQNKWMRVVKVPWSKKIFIEGNEPTKAQKQVLEDWYFEDKSRSIIWQRWVSSKFGPLRPVTLFPPENVTDV